MRYLVNWVLTQCGAPETACRAQCMTLFMQLAPVQQGLSVLCLSVCVVSICPSLPLVLCLLINYVRCMYMYTVFTYTYSVCTCTLYVRVLYTVCSFILYVRMYMYTVCTSTLLVHTVLLLHCSDLLMLSTVFRHPFCSGMD